MFLIGYDIGSSSVKAVLLDGQTGKVAASAVSPVEEMAIIAHQPGWAEQDPLVWWENLKLATAQIRSAAPAEFSAVKAVGISYQMHGLVLVDKELRSLRPAIIWCDSRAVDIGRRAAEQIGPDICLERLGNLPGNFTASKLKWVMENEPDIFCRTHKVLLPGDYIAMRLCGGSSVNTTVSGLSEGVFWDFQRAGTADLILDNYGISKDLLADVVPTFSVQGRVGRSVATELGLPDGVLVSYRAGDQPNNAFSLNVLEPGDLAATAGTSGVIYAVTDRYVYDRHGRVNTFVHVNHTNEAPRYGVLVCINGTGILNSWLRRNILADSNLSYSDMNKLAGEVPIGSDLLAILPYGNGAERTLGDDSVGCCIDRLHFNLHDRRHLFRAAQEGIVFGMEQGLAITKKMGVRAETIRVGRANMFLSDLFCEAFANVTGAKVELYDTDGAQGAARGAGIGVGLYKNRSEAFGSLAKIATVEPDESLRPKYLAAYEHWCAVLARRLLASS